MFRKATVPDQHSGYRVWNHSTVSGTEELPGDLHDMSTGWVVARGSGRGKGSGRGQGSNGRERERRRSGRVMCSLGSTGGRVTKGLGRVRGEWWEDEVGWGEESVWNWKATWISPPHIYMVSIELEWGGWGVGGVCGERRGRGGETYM